jgi:monovalent cation:H+ antiporter-2, CPA2 family
VVRHAWLLAGAILATLVVKTAMTSAAVMMAGWPLRVGLHLGLVLATVSEFSYVVAREAERAGMFPGGWLELIIAYIVGTMLLGAAITPVAETVSAAVSGRLRPWRMKAREEEPLAELPVSLSNHVVVVGSGFTGYSLSRALAAAKIPFCVVEMNRSLAAAARELGGEVVVGDATRMSILEKAGLATARALVVVINDRQATRRVVAQARTARPDLYVLARTHYLAELDELARLGASRVISEEFESSIEILAHILKEFAIPDNVVEAEVALVRAGRYAMLRGQPVATARLELLGILQRTATQTFLLEHDSAACGRTLRELDLRAATGASIIALVRDGKPITNPGPDLKFEPNDVLVLVGTHAQIDKAKALLR